MKYLGLIVDDKDIATKEYVDSHTSRPAYKQTLTATGSSGYWYYRIPYDADYSFEDMMNFVAYFYHTGERPGAAPATFRVVKVGDYWSYNLSFPSEYYPASGDTIVVENMFTDQGTLTMSM